MLKVNKPVKKKYTILVWFYKLVDTGCENNLNFVFVSGFLDAKCGHMTI